MRIRSAARSDAIGEVANDQRVRAGVDLHVAARRQRAARDHGHEVRGLRVAHRHRQGAQLAGERLRFAELAALFVFLRQHVQRHDAHDVAVDAVAELVGAQDDVERLVPRHVAERHVDGALDARVDDDVQAVADFRERAEHGAKIGALEVERDGIAGELALCRLVSRCIGGSVGCCMAAAITLGIGTGSGAWLIVPGSGIPAAIIGGVGGAGAATGAVATGRAAGVAGVSATGAATTGSSIAAGAMAAAAVSTARRNMTRRSSPICSTV